MTIGHGKNDVQWQLLQNSKPIVSFSRSQLQSLVIVEFFYTVSQGTVMRGIALGLG